MCWDDDQLYWGLFLENYFIAKTTTTEMSCIGCVELVAGDFVAFAWDCFSFE